MTVSDGVAAGTREDESGKLLVDLLTEEGFEVQHRVVPDERPRIAAALRELANSSRLVLTTGGTGLSQRDFTPEATASVIERPVPGIAGRSPSYLVRQLYDMQQGARKGIWTDLMKRVVAKLTTEDMLNIAAYTASRTAAAEVSRSAR